MDLFLERLAEVDPSPDGRRWLFVPYDQLSDRIALLDVDPERRDKDRRTFRRVLAAGRELEPGDLG